VPSGQLPALRKALAEPLNRQSNKQQGMQQVLERLQPFIKDVSDLYNTDPVCRTHNHCLLLHLSKFGLSQQYRPQSSINCTHHTTDKRSSLLICRIWHSARLSNCNHVILADLALSAHISCRNNMTANSWNDFCLVWSPLTFVQAHTCLLSRLDGLLCCLPSPQGLHTMLTLQEAATQDRAESLRSVCVCLLNLAYTCAGRHQLCPACA